LTLANARRPSNDFATSAGRLRHRFCVLVAREPIVVGAQQDWVGRGVLTLSSQKSAFLAFLTMNW
jgi:predicted methyltransferase